MKPHITLLGVFCVLLIPLAFGEQDVHQTAVMKSSTTIAGEKIAYPITEKAEIQSTLIEIPPGKETTLMLHSVPTYIYVVEGTLTVEFDDGSRQRFEAGKGFLQAMRKRHKGKNLEQVPLRFLVVFAGVQGESAVIHPAER